MRERDRSPVHSVLGSHVIVEGDVGEIEASSGQQTEITVTLPDVQSRWIIQQQRIRQWLMLRGARYA